jgi:hypothetical protein
MTTTTFVLLAALAVVGAVDFLALAYHDARPRHGAAPLRISLTISLLVAGGVLLAAGVGLLPLT